MPGQLELHALTQHDFLNFAVDLEFLAHLGSETHSFNLELAP